MEGKNNMYYNNKNSRNRSNNNAVKKDILSMSQLKIRLDKGSGVYKIYWPAMNMLIGEVNFLKDNQYIRDVAAMQKIADILSQRLNITKNRIKPSSMHTSFKNQNVYAEIFYMQVDVSRYEFYLPNGLMCAWITTPPDRKYESDLTVIKETCVALAQRYNLI